jgi:hypothetical protein
MRCSIVRVRLRLLMDRQKGRAASLCSFTIDMASLFIDSMFVTSVCDSEMLDGTVAPDEPVKIRVSAHPVN